jgi:tetratricopeptide (TPR) repeat protein
VRRDPRQRKRPKITEEDARRMAEAMGLRMLTMTIKYGPMEVSTLPPEVDGQMTELWELVHENPAAAVPRIEGLLKDFPEVPQLRNYLCAALQQLGKYQRVMKIIEEDYHRFPNYLFARAAYGTLLLKEGRMEEFERLFALPIHPRAWYSEREEFHITEAVTVLALAALYDIKRGEFGQATQLIKELEKLAPDNAMIADVKRELNVARRLLSTGGSGRAGR